MAWTSISPELDQFNQWMVLILAVILLYTGIEKMQKVLIENMPNSEHDKKLRKFDKFIGKVQYFEHIMSREDLTDSQKVQFIKKELGNLK